MTMVDCLDNDLSFPEVSNDRKCGNIKAICLIKSILLTQENNAQSIFKASITIL